MQSMLTVGGGGGVGAIVGKGVGAIVGAGVGFGVTFGVALGEALGEAFGDAEGWADSDGPGEGLGLGVMTGMGVGVASSPRLGSTGEPSVSPGARLIGGSMEPTTTPLGIGPGEPVTVPVSLGPNNWNVISATTTKIRIVAESRHSTRRRSDPWSRSMGRTGPAATASGPGLELASRPASARASSPLSDSATNCRIRRVTSSWSFAIVAGGADPGGAQAPGLRLRIPRRPWMAEGCR